MVRFDPCLNFIVWIVVFSTTVLNVQTIRAANNASSPFFTATPLEIETSTAEGFTRLDSSRTGIDFKNLLAGDAFLTDAVAHNGSGLALGDVDGDQRVDIYFCGLHSPNKLFKNLGNWKFQEQEIGAASCAEQRSTAAAFVDIDGDEDLDLLVNGIAAGTRLFLNDGTGHFSESKETGLLRTSSPTSMALADIDQDGDLDLYCAQYVDVMYTADPTTHYALARQNGNYVVTHVNGKPTTNPGLRNRFAVSSTGRLKELPEFDALYLNMGHGTFKPIQFQKGTFNNQAGRPVMPPRDWSLAVMFRDLNGDHFPDLYVCTDNATPDRVWINNGNGTFRAQEPTAIRHTSRSSMGIDFADINRDGLDDFFVADMFARKHVKRMTQLAKQYSDPQEILHPNGRPRYNRNTLFLGQSDHSFVETALMAGVAASDWSWCPVFMDVDLDGFEDLLVTNGFSFDVMDQDSQDSLRTMQISKHERQRSRQFHPPFVTPNAAFRNVGDGLFEPADDLWGFDIKGISNGMALADLDQDGDQDAVINQLNEQPIILKNITSKPRIKVSLEGNTPNTKGIGARIQFVQGSITQSQVIIGGGRYLSSDEASRVFGYAKDSIQPGRLEVHWPDKTITKIENIRPNHHYRIIQKGASQLPKKVAAPSSPLFRDVSHLIGHRFNTPIESGNAALPNPNHLEDTSPGLAWHDINGDGWEDLWVSAGRGERPAIYLNQNGTSFQKIPNLTPVKDAQGKATGWNDGKGGRFWLVATQHRSTHPQRESAVLIYSHQSQETLVTLDIGKPGIGDLEVADVDGDGDEDLFVATTSPWGRYPELTDSQIWINEEGTLRLSEQWSQAFQSAGIVRGAVYFNLDSDSHLDLALATEWGPIKIFRNTGKRFEEMTDHLNLSSSNGWWTDIQAGDFNGDGQIDLVATNRGRNTELALFGKTSFRIWYGDQDGNKHLETVSTWKSGNQWLPISNRTTLSQILPILPQRIQSHLQFANSSVEEILADAFTSFQWLEATTLDSSVFIRSAAGFDRISLPQEVQQSPSFCVQVIDLNNDTFQDFFIGQNVFSPHSELTRHDSGKGLLCLGVGNGMFDVISANKTGFQLPGEQRDAQLIDYNKDGNLDISLTHKQSGIILLEKE